MQVELYIKRFCSIFILTNIIISIQTKHFLLNQACLGLSLDMWTEFILASP